MDSSLVTDDVINYMFNIRKLCIHLKHKKLNLFTYDKNHLLFLYEIDESANL